MSSRPIEGKLLHTRRRVLGAALAGLFGACLGVLPVRLRPSSTHATGASVDLETGLADLLPDPVAARHIGAAFLRMRPGIGAPGLLEMIEPLDLGSPRSAVAAQVRRDFDAGRVVSLGGWYLAQTEAALFALAGLTMERRRG